MLLWVNDTSERLVQTKYRVDLSGEVVRPVPWQEMVKFLVVVLPKVRKIFGQ